MKTRRLVSVDRRPGEILVFSNSQTTDGFWIVNGFLRRLAADVDALAVGEAVHAALDVSVQGVPTPSPQVRLFDQFLTTLGVTSYRKYAADIVSVMVELEVTADATTAIVEPQRHTGRGAFSAMTDAAIELSGPSTEELGRAVLAMLDKAE